MTFDNDKAAQRANPEPGKDTERPVGRSIPIPAERHARILEFLARHGAASIHAIAAEISVSPSRKSVV